RDATVTGVQTCALPIFPKTDCERAFPDRPFAVRFWDGSEIGATKPGAPTFTVRSPKACAHVLRAPGELGLGRAYVQGLVDVDDQIGRASCRERGWARMG